MPQSSTSDMEQQGIAHSIEKALTNHAIDLVNYANIVNEDGQRTGEIKPRFIIQKQGYLAIKSYVAAGMIFPQTAENFTKLHPESELKKLTELDPLIYEQVKTAMVTVHEHCNEFNTKALSNFMRISRETRGYAEEAYDKLIGSGENSFQGMLDILTSDDYKEEAAQNSDEFKGARECASGILADLSRHAGEKKHIVGNLISEIDVFTGQIQADHVLVGEVVAKFNGTKETPGFCSILNTEVEELRKNAMEAAKTAQREHELAEQEDAIADWALKQYWGPLFGWIVGGTLALVHHLIAKREWEKYKADAERAAKLNYDFHSLEKMVSGVMLLSGLNSSILSMMPKAMEALRDIHKSFERLESELGKVAADMGSANTQIGQGLWSRKRNLRATISKVTKEWEDVIIACKGLEVTDQNITVLGITDDVVPPRMV